MAIRSLSVDIEAFGEIIVQRELLRFNHNLRSYRPAMEKAATILRTAVRKQFASEGQYGVGAASVASGGGSTIAIGEGWPALAESTVARKRREQLDPRILRATGDLYRSLTRKGGAAHIETVSAYGLRFGSTVPYAMYHQSTRPRHKLPYRPPVALSEMDKRKITQEIQKHALKGITG